MLGSKHIAGFFALWLMGLAIIQPVAAQDSQADFFVPPANLPAGQPGDLIRVRAAQAGPPSARALARAWQVMYLSTSALGEPVATTATVLVPREGDPAAMALVGIGPGTQGPAFRCTASRMIDKGAFYEQAAINDMLRAGHAVAVTDYQGYHPEPDTTYMIGRAMGASLLDAVRAAQRLPEAGLSADAPVVLRGYSQGGGAAMWAAQMHPDYAPELALEGVAGGGVPANLARVALPLDGQAGFGVMFYALLGQDNAYPELTLNASLNEAGQAAVREMQQRMCVLSLLQEFEGDSLADYTDSNPIDSARLQRIGENQLGQVPINVPVFLYHEEEDGLVAFGQARELRDDYCGQGTRLRWRTWDTRGENGVIRHINLVHRANGAVNEFITARLNNEPFQSNCDG